jgi:cation diffusion facilitator CzcD-associated flavoprotein CzcO
MNIQQTHLKRYDIFSGISDLSSLAPVFTRLDTETKTSTSVTRPTFFFAESGSFLLETPNRDFYLTPESGVLVRSGQEITIRCLSAGMLGNTIVAPTEVNSLFSSDVQFDIKLMSEVYDIIKRPYSVSAVGGVKLLFGRIGDIVPGGVLVAGFDGDKCLFAVPYDSPPQPRACDVLVIGAGPIGLGIGASTANNSLDTIILGEPLSFWWQNILPQPLRSPLSASSIYIDRDSYDLSAFCKHGEINPAGVLQFPVFLAYAQSVLNRYEHLVRTERVDGLRRTADGWLIDVTTPYGAVTYSANSVVVATGLLPMANIPGQVSPGKAVRHASAVNRFDLERPDIQAIAVVGGGQSALEFALHAWKCGKDVSVVIRESELMFRNLHEPGHYLYKELAKRSERMTPWLSGPLKSKLLSFLLRGTVEPRLRDEILNSDIKILGNFRIAGLERFGSRIRLQAEDKRELHLDSVIFGTGYSWTLERLGFLKNLLGLIKSEAGMPRLTAACESSIPGLFFAGYGAMRRVGFKSQFIQGSRLITPAILKEILRRRECKNVAG